MENNSEKRFYSPFEFCSDCGEKLKIDEVKVRRINHGRLDIYTYVLKCEKCNKKIKQNRIKTLYR